MKKSLFTLGIWCFLVSALFAQEIYEKNIIGERVNQSHTQQPENNNVTDYSHLEDLFGLPSFPLETPELDLSDFEPKTTYGDPSYKDKRLPNLVGSAGDIEEYLDEKDRKLKQNIFIVFGIILIAAISFKRFYLRRR